MNLEASRQIAKRAVEYFSPACSRIEIAGSIRRQRPECGDVDLVVELRDRDLFRSLCRRCRRVVTEGEQNVIVEGARMQVDIFIARPETRDLLETVPGNWGSLLLCRTGSKNHNIFLVERAKRLGLRWNPYQGVYDGHGKCQASVTEQDIFAALQLDFVPPERRER